MGNRLKIYMMVVNKKTGKTIDIKRFSSEEEIKEFIKTITTTDLKTKRYEFEGHKEARDIFEKLYKPEFFEYITEDLGKGQHVVTGIHLKQLPNGIRRSKTYHKKPYNEKTLENTLMRIRKTLEEDFSKIDVSFDIQIRKKETINERYEDIVIKLENLREHAKTTTPYQCLILFDKIDWTYTVTTIHFAYDDVSEIIQIIKKAFEKHTSSTRNYRSRHAYYA